MRIGLQVYIVDLIQCCPYPENFTEFFLRSKDLQVSIGNYFVLLNYVLEELHVDYILFCLHLDNLQQNLRNFKTENQAALIQSVRLQSILYAHGLKLTLENSFNL